MRAGKPFQEKLSGTDSSYDDHTLINLVLKTVLCFTLVHVLHHPEHCRHDTGHHRDRHRPAAPHVSAAPRDPALAYVLYIHSHFVKHDINLHHVHFCFRTSVQENLIALKVKAQVIIELPLSVSG